MRAVIVSSAQRTDGGSALYELPINWPKPRIRVRGAHLKIWTRASLRGRDGMTERLFLAPTSWR